jgi:peptidoglycan-associated lipoprotein
MKNISALALIAALTTAAGCAHDAPPPAPTPTSAPAPVTLRPATAGKTNSTIFLSDELRKQCAIGVVESSKTAPKFAFDESAITSDDRDVLARIAECLTTGPLKGKSVKLVGRADMRGTTEYNMALGARRSDAVTKYLLGMGVPSSQMVETSRGELDATGNGEEGWRKDRRVDIDVQ